jgi:hypothetical protein
LEGIRGLWLRFLSLFQTENAGKWLENARKLWQILELDGKVLTISESNRKILWFLKNSPRKPSKSGGKSWETVGKLWNLIRKFFKSLTITRLVLETLYRQNSFSTVFTLFSPSISIIFLWNSYFFAISSQDWFLHAFLTLPLAIFPRFPSSIFPQQS